MEWLMEAVLSNGRKGTEIGRKWRVYEILDACCWYLCLCVVKNVDASFFWQTLTFLSSVSSLSYTRSPLFSLTLQGLVFWQKFKKWCREEAKLPAGECLSWRRGGWPDSFWQLHSSLALASLAYPLCIVSYVWTSTLRWHLSSPSETGQKVGVTYQIMRLGIELYLHVYRLLELELDCVICKCSSSPAGLWQGSWSEC